MLSLPRLFLPLLLIAALPGSAHAESGASLYARLAGQAKAGTCFEVDIDLDNGPGLNGDNGELTYPMAFNNVAEGWSWQPGSQPDLEDYYRYKFLPLGSTEEARGEYRAEDQIGEMQTMQVRWRYDYFLAFDNIYDFYRREVNDAAGFASHLPASLAANTAMRARACLEEPLSSESTTFWKATHGQPVDFTLKKRYLIGKLQAIDFVDRHSATIISSVTPLPQAAP